MRITPCFHSRKALCRALAALCLSALFLLPVSGVCEAIDPIESAEPTEAPEEALYLDDQRESVRAAQRRLIELGLLTGGADGVIGPVTRSALTEFQSQNDLEPTGRLDEATFEKLTRIDPSSATVKDVQQRLIDLGYLQGTADGKAGPKSVEALKRFQNLNGLTADGRAGDDTLEVLFSARAVALPQTLSPGSKGEAVGRLQQSLIRLGFLEGEADESYGQSTSAAVRAFQQHLVAQGYGDESLVDGVATPLTQYCLLSDDYSSYLRDVEPGASDSEVLRIERRLLQLGYTDLPADDLLDDTTLIALDLFKEQAGFETAGDADKETLDALFAANAPEAEYCVPHDIRSGDSGQVVRDVETALINGGMLMRMATGNYNGTLESALERLHEYLVAQDDPNAPLFADPKAISAQGVEALVDGLLSYRIDSADSETEIRRMQTRLYMLLYLEKSGVDGLMGSDSRAALKAFQAANELQQTGRADGDTLDLLYSPDALANPYPWRVEVSIDEQKVRIYELTDERRYELVQTFKCSTGLHNSTPRGIFLDGHPVNRWHHFEKFNCWAQYSFEVQGDIMFHSVIYSSNNENSLRSGSLYALGNPASHGCIRLSVEDAKWLFEHCKRGTVAIIIY